MDAKMKRLLARLANGEAPRCSRKESVALWALLPGKVQLESRHGADTSGGYVLTPPKSSGDTTVALRALLAGHPN